MFRNLLPRLFGETPPETGLSADDAEMAVAALLVRIARADNHYTQAEKARIDALLGRRQGLTPALASDRRAAAEMLEAEAPDTVRFTRVLKEAVPIEERAGLIEAMWSVALVDLSRYADEDALIRMVANLLGLTDVESARARQRSLQDPSTP